MKYIFILFVFFLIGCQQQVEQEILEQESDTIETITEENIEEDIDEELEKEFDDNLDEALQELEEIENI